MQDYPLTPLTDKIRQKYPEESKKWEDLITKASDPKYRGCYTCKFYTEIDSGGGEYGFADVESVNENIDDDWLPWDTEDAWVWCSLNRLLDTPLKINCPNWENLERKIRDNKT